MAIVARQKREYSDSKLLSRETESIGYRGGMQAFEGSGFEIVRCDPSREQAALELAAGAWPATEKSAYRQAIQHLIDRGNVERVVLVAACREKKLVAAQLAQMLAGRASLAWPPKFVAADEVERERELIAGIIGRRLISDLKQGGIHIVQSLIAPGETDSEKWLAIGGFSHAADLLYLAANAEDAPLSPQKLSFALEAFQPSAMARLIDVVQRTYVGTLDCPQIDGLRDTADVISGYQSVGDYQPALWFFVRHDGHDVGCLLLNQHSDVQHLEIVYLALTPEVRGRGWGLQLTKQALWLARETSSRRAVLAVDAANEPAVRLYFVAGFEVFDRRAVWLHTFP